MLLPRPAPGLFPFCGHRCSPAAGPRGRGPRPLFAGVRCGTKQIASVSGAGYFFVRVPPPNHVGFLIRTLFWPGNPKFWPGNPPLFPPCFCPPGVAGVALWGRIFVVLFWLLVG